MTIRWVRFPVIRAGPLRAPRPSFRSPDASVRCISLATSASALLPCFLCHRGSRTASTVAAASSHAPPGSPRFSLLEDGPGLSSGVCERRPRAVPHADRPDGLRVHRSGAVVGPHDKPRMSLLIPARFGAFATERWWRPAQGLTRPMNRQSSVRPVDGHSPRPPRRLLRRQDPRETQRVHSRCVSQPKPVKSTAPKEARISAHLFGTPNTLRICNTSSPHICSQLATLSANDLEAPGELPRRSGPPAENGQ